MFKSIFAVVIAIANGTEKYANAYAKTGEWAEEAAQAFVDKAKAERELSLEEFQQQLDARKAKRLPKPKAVV
jgi:hypothetical protein